MPNDAPRPPYVQFELRAVEDRTQSLEAGHYVPKDVIFAIVTPAGTKDRIEKVAEEWLLSVEEGVKQDRIPESWLGHFRQSYENFKNSRETPENGFPITDWPAVSPSQTRLLLDLNIRTVEDLAEANEQAVMAIGMGGRALKAKAQAWLDASKETGKTAGELETLRTRNSELETRNDELTARNEALEKQVKALTEKPSKEKENA